jgi:hypothetical protein
MKDIHYDAEGDILTVNFVKTTDKPQAQKHIGVELVNNIILHFDPAHEQPLEMIVVSYSRLVKLTRRSPMQMKKLLQYPKRLQRIALKLIQQAPVSNFLELKISDTDVYGSVKVKKVALEPKILEEAA